MSSSQKRLPRLAGLLAVLVVAACAGDRGATSPPAPLASSEVAMPAMPSVAAAGATRATRIERPAGGDARHLTMASVAASNALSYQFTVNPTQSMTFIIGEHMVSFLANTICDPSSSGYGPATWQQQCARLTQSIVITATTWIDDAGRSRIDFANALRFAPNAQSQLPAIDLRDADASLKDWGRVDYCADNGPCTIEAASDAALATQRDPATGFLFRLVRHFAGYNVWA